MGRFSPGDKQEARRRVGAPADLPLILMLANLAPHKGQETAIRAVSILRRMGTPAILWLAGIERGGTGEFTRKLQGMIGELGLENCVDLLGQRDDVQDLLRASDAFLLPSTNEGLPLSILEAQATGVPVLAAPTAGVPEIIADGRNGFLILADDAQGYADRIRMLLENPSRSRLVTEEALRGTRHRHAWSTYAQQILELYASVMGEPTRLHSQSPRPASAADVRP